MMRRWHFFASAAPPAISDQQQPDSFVRQSQMSQQLFLVNGRDALGRLHFHYHHAIDNQVGSKATVQTYVFPHDGDRPFLMDCKS